MLGRKAIFRFLHGSSKQGKVNVKIGHFEVKRLGEQERCRIGKPNFGRANDFSLIKNQAILKNMTLYKNLIYIDFVNVIRQS